MKRFIPLLVCLLCVPLAGCPSQNTTAALIGIAEVAVSSLETIEGNTAAAQQIQTDFSAAQSAVLNFKAGSPTQDVAQALKLVQDDLNLLPVSKQDEAYINLAIGTINSILLLFPQPTTGLSAHTSLVPHRTIVSNTPPPKNAAEFKAQWNAIHSAAPLAGLRALQ